MKPRFRAERVVVSEEMLILASCLLRPMSRNSVLEELRVRRFTGTHIPHGITQCYLPPGRGDTPAFTPTRLVLDLATPEHYKAELT